KGLDLQGGVHFLMKVDQKAALEKRLDATSEDLRVLLRDNRIAYTSVDRRPDNSVVVTLRDATAAGTAAGLITKIQPTLMQQSQGNKIVLQAPPAELQRYAADAIEQNVTNLRH